MKQAIGELSFAQRRIEQHQIKVEHLPNFGILTQKQTQLLMKLARIGKEFRISVHPQCGLSRSAFNSRLQGLIKRGVVIRISPGLYAIKTETKQEYEEYVKKNIV